MPLSHIFFHLKQNMSVSPSARLVLIPSTAPHMASILYAKQELAMEPKIKTLHLEPLLPIPCTYSRDVEMRHGCCSVSRRNLGRLGNWCFAESEYCHLKCTNLFEVSFTLSFGNRLSVKLGLIRSCPPHDHRFWWRKDFEAARKQKLVF